MDRQLDFTRPGIVIHDEKIAFQGVDRRGVPERRVLCVVSREALDDHGRLVGAGRDERHEVFNEAMGHIFAIASRKYYEGLLEPGGSVLVTSDDLNP
jgi:hypothetical protein